MLPFDRLVAAVDAWAASRPDATVKAQIGMGYKYRAQNLICSEMLTPSEYKAASSGADVLVSHAGMGTIITATESRVPLIVLPRRKELGEVTSDHQIATCRWLRNKPGIYVANTTEEIVKLLEEFDTTILPERNKNESRNELIYFVREFLNSSLSRDKI